MENLPKIFKIRQKIDAPHLENIEKRVNELLDQFGLSQESEKGRTDWFDSRKPRH